MHIDSLVEATVAVAFWVFLTVSAYAAIKYDFRKRQLAMESLRAAIERGQPLEPAVVEQILDRHSGSAGDDAQDLAPYLRIGGVITIAGGVGVFIAAFFVGLQFPIAKLPMLGTGVLAVCIGVGLLVAARIAWRDR
jgi:Domain of unknown function (DUF6249)